MPNQALGVMGERIFEAKTTRQKSEELRGFWYMYINVYCFLYVPTCIYGTLESRERDNEAKYKFSCCLEVAG